MNLNFYSGMTTQNIAIIAAIAFLLAVLGKKSNKLFYSILFSAIISVLTMYFYQGTLTMGIVFAISFFLNYFTSLIAFSLDDKVESDNPGTYIVLFELFYNGLYFLIVFGLNFLIK